ncbi:MAG: hypothetical protein WCD31_08880 [Gillisia sp.]
MSTSEYKNSIRKGPEELHQETIDCLSDLYFMVDENEFFSDLIKEHTLELLSGKMYEESKKVIDELLIEKEKLHLFLHEVEEHRNHLQILNSTKDISENNTYKNKHAELMLQAVAFKAGFKNLKKEIFNLIKKSMNASRQKRLLQKNASLKNQLKNLG